MKKVKVSEMVLRGSNSPAEMIRTAVSGKANLEQLKGLLDLQERWEANEARKAYHQAMSNFKSENIAILKEVQVNYATKTGGQVKYKHASLSNITNIVTPLLSKYGLSIAWKPTQIPGFITITCKVTHVQGHSEEFALTGPADDSGGKNAIQAIGSTAQYLERYTTLAALGLATQGEDNDGKGSEEIKLIGNREMNFIRDNLIDLNQKEGDFLKYMKLEKLEDMPLSDFKKAEVAIEAKRKALKK